MVARLNNKKALIMSAFLLPTLLSVNTLTAANDYPPDRIDTSHQVAHIYDGDTVRLRNGDKVRFIGINTPEIGRDGKPSEAFARKAKNRLAQLLKNHNYILNLRYGNEQRDRYQRLLAHAYLADNRSIGAILLREGLAAQVTIPPNVRNLRCYHKAESIARAVRCGIWSLAQSNGVDASKLTDKTKGFRIISGLVNGIHRQRDVLYLNLQDRLNLRIDKGDRKYFDPAFLQGLKGRRIRVRGWVSARNHVLQMRLRHPAAIEVE